MSRVQKSVAKWVGAFLLSFCSFSYSNAQIVTVPIPGAPGLTITVGTGVNALPLQNIQNNPNAVNITQGDDSWTNVPLGFDFPMYGRTFNNSWAMTNGMVTFQDPTVSGIWGACCSGINLSQTTDTRWNYSIFALHTDLYSWNSNSQYYLRGTNEMTYGWYNLSQCCSSQGGNSFEVKINSSGLIDTRIAGALVGWNAVTSGFSGDLSKGEYYQHYHGQGLNIVPGSANIFSWQALGGTGGGADLCLANPLSSPTCPNYATAYLNQQCTISALYNPSCPGYAAAYFTQQCSLNSLYNENCPGYAAAYLQYQCSINALYSTTCEGYEQAYFTQQCTLNSLYNTQCPGYQQAYFNQQCTLNGLYDTQCPNYAQAYATKQALERNSNPPASTQTVATPTTNTSEPARVAVVADPIVNSVVTSTATSTSPAQSATATVPLVSTPQTTTPVTTAVVAKEQKQEKTDAASTSTSSSSTTQNSPSSSDNKENQPKTARQELQERRVAAARAQAVEQGKNLAASVGQAASLEQQVAVQNVVIAAMGYTPGFDAYGKSFIPDGVGYRPFTIYNNQRTVDNRSASRMFSGSDNLHQQMIDSQYGR